MTRIAHIEHAEKAHDSAIFVVEDLHRPCSRPPTPCRRWCCCR